METLYNYNQILFSFNSDNDPDKSEFTNYNYNYSRKTLDLWDNILSILALSEFFSLAQKKLCSIKTESVSDSVKLSVETQSGSGGKRLSNGRSTFFMENCH